MTEHPQVAYNYYRKLIRKGIDIKMLAKVNHYQARLKLKASKSDFKKFNDIIINHLLTKEDVKLTKIIFDKAIVAIYQVNGHFNHDKSLTSHFYYSNTRFKRLTKPLHDALIKAFMHKAGAQLHLTMFGQVNCVGDLTYVSKLDSIVFKINKVNFESVN